MIFAVLGFRTAGVAFAAPAVSDDSAEAASKATKQEIQIGRKAEESVEGRWPRVMDPALEARVNTILAKLTPYAGRRLDYNGRVIDAGDMINAFSLPGGTMYVTKAMLDFVKTDSELAGVMAHEIVHADRSHGVKQAARNEKLTLLALAVAIASQGRAAGVLLANVAQVAIMGAYSIEFEKEADSYGIAMMTRAGYNPVGMLTLQESLATEAMRHPYVDPGIYQTHPDTKERIKMITQFMTEHAIPIRRKYSLGLLRTSVEEASGDVSLAIDGVPVWGGKDSNECKTYLLAVKSRLDDSLQLETAPYDISTADSRSGRALVVMGKVMASEGEAPKGMEPIAPVRDKIQACLESARRSHPTANFFK